MVKKKMEMPAATRKQLEEAGSQNISWWQYAIDEREYAVIVTRDPIDDSEEPRWHVSVAGRTDVPPWADLVAIGHDVRPGVWFSVTVPPKHLWLNIHPNVLHLWESRDEKLEAQHRYEGELMKRQTPPT